MNRLLPLFSASRLGRPEGRLVPPLRLVEGGTELHAAGLVASDFVSHDGVLVAAFADRSLRAFDAADLSARWSMPLPGEQHASRFHGAPVFHGGNVVVQTGGEWGVHDRRTGEVKASFRAPPMALRRGVPDGNAFLSTWWDDTSARLGRLDPGTGELAWSRPLEGPADGALALSNGVVALAVSPTRLAAFDVASGEPRWTFDVSAIGRRTGPFDPPTGMIAGWPVVAAGLFLLPVRWSHWVAIDPTSGEERWRRSVEADDPGLAALPAADHLVVICEGRVTALDPEDGTEAWSVTFANPGWGPYGAPEVSAGHLYAAGARDGRMLAVDAGSGQIAWTGPAGGATPPDRPPLILGSQLVTADIDGTVRLFRAADGRHGVRKRKPREEP